MAREVLKTLGYKVLTAIDGEQALVVKVNVDENPDLAGRYGIRSIPTVMVFKQGEVQQTLVGVQPQQQYLAALQT